MRRLAYTLATFVIVVVAFATAGAVFSQASAAEVGETRIVTGTLEDHENDAYTHKVDGYNLKLDERYNDWEGKTVILTVVYTTETNFTVTALSLVEAAEVSVVASGTTRTITGTLVEHENSAYTHRIGAFNLILNSMYNDWEGKTVRLTVVYTSATRFTVTGLSLVEAASQPAGVVSSAAAFTGTLTQSPRATRDYRITSATGAYVDILVSGNYDSWLGQEVVMTYSGTLTSFTLLSLALK